ncbi:MAG: YfiR family protein [Verrucomicrobia bacterium]|jgi:hypothetical protein|nr:YfiR family protein [Verrucomicrobiota bacterium]
MTILNNSTTSNISIRIVLLLTVLSLSVPTFGQKENRSKTIDPRDLYAAFLTKLPHFITWPNTKERRKRPALRIGIIGENVFPQHSIGLMNTQIFEGRPFRVIEIAKASEIGELDILFVGASEEQRIEKIIQATKGKSILTIAAIPRFAHRGGMINFSLRGGYSRFEINLKQVGQEKIKISAKLLRTTIIVE